ncbi:MAG: hypothetical protein JWN04_1797 [Myxococcaceae bacterium]|nr:hypothetical protein [Myxococcaceae bacterium]
MRQLFKARRSMVSMELLIVGLLGASLGSCGSDDGTTTADDEDGGTGRTGSACAEHYATEACTCGALPGSQYCGADGWSECECQLPGGGTIKGNAGNGATGTSAVPAGNLRSDIMFDWERTPPVSGSCEPGYYGGTFAGIYASQLTFVNAAIPVVAIDVPGMPGLAFTLTKKAGSGEQLVIENGMMNGDADGLFPFIGTLTGSLDCTTLKFNAILDGYYSLGVNGVGMFRFKGPLVADYDKATHQVINATWNVLEYDPPPANFVTPAGGQGTWSASWLHP